MDVLNNKLTNIKVEHWDHPRIVEVNPTIKLSHEEISVIYRSDRSGITKVFTTALSKFRFDFVTYCDVKQILT